LKRTKNAELVALTLQLFDDSTRALAQQIAVTAVCQSQAPLENFLRSVEL
jgi:hypothetical protein